MLLQWNLQIKDTLGPAILSSVERLSSSWRLKMNYCYGKGVQNCILCLEVSLSQRVLYRRFCSSHVQAKKAQCMIGGEVFLECHTFYRREWVYWTESRRGEIMRASLFPFMLENITLLNVGLDEPGEFAHYIQHHIF